MSNSDNKNATIEYTKFVQSSRHSEMKAIFDTFIPFILFKECLDKKEKNEQEKLLEEKKKKEGVEGERILVNDLQREIQLNKSSNNNIIKDNNNNKFESEEVEEDSEKSEDPFDLTKDYDKVFNFNLITDEEKDEFRKGKPLPYLKHNLLNLISKKFSGTVPPPLPRQEQYHFQLISFRFKDVSLMRCPKICFKQNVSLFDNIPDPQASKPLFFGNNTDENSISSSNKNLIHTSSKNLLKTTTLLNNNNNNQKNYNKKRFLKYKSFQNNKSEMMSDESSNSSDEDKKEKEKNNGKEDETSSNLERNSGVRDSIIEVNTFKKDKKGSDLMFRNKTNSINNYNARPSKIIQSEMPLSPFFYFKTEKGKENKFIKFNKNYINYDSVKKTLSTYSIDENFPESKNKIAIPSDNLRQEIFIFDPIGFTGGFNSACYGR